MKPNKSKLTILQQVCQLIPGHIVKKLATKHKIQTRSYSPWSHVVSLLYAQLTHSLSLNDICDSLENHSSALKEIRGATAPRRNTLSHANKNRNVDMAEELFGQFLIVYKRLFLSLVLGVNTRLSQDGLKRRFMQLIQQQ